MISSMIIHKQNPKVILNALTLSPNKEIFSESTVHKFCKNVILIEFSKILIIAVYAMLIKRFNEHNPVKWLLLMHWQ